MFSKSVWAFYSLHALGSFGRERVDSRAPENMMYFNVEVKL